LAVPNEALFVLILQLHGYWIKYGAKAGRPPLALLLSEKSIQVVLFPFQESTTKTEVVESILLPEYPLWADKEKLCMNK